MTEQLSIITKVANKVAKEKYPLFGENHYSDFDVATILHSYFIVVEHTQRIKNNEVPKAETVQEQSPV